MLQRASHLEARRELSRQRNRRLRQRRREGVACYLVPIPDTVLEQMIAWGWFTEADSCDRALVGRVIGAQLAASAKR
jgi:hypothetical protein